MLTWRGSTYGVTFNREVFDQHSNTLRFLTYGEPLLEELLRQVAVLPAEDVGVIRLTGEEVPPRVGYSRLDGGQAHQIRSLEELRQVVATRGPEWDPQAEKEARNDYPQRCCEFHARKRSLEERQQQLLYSQLKARGQLCL